MAINTYTHNIGEYLPYIGLNGLQSLNPRCRWFFDNLVKLSQGVIRALLFS
jgi:hypothetical protein